MHYGLWIERRERERERTWSWPKSNQTWYTSGNRVTPLEISQTEAPISKHEYRATIAFAAKTNLQKQWIQSSTKSPLAVQQKGGGKEKVHTHLKASKSYQRGEFEPRELVSIKTAAAREKQKDASRRTRINVLNRFSFCTKTVDWKLGFEIRGWWGDGASPFLKGWEDRMVVDSFVVQRDIDCQTREHEKSWEK